MCDNNRTIHLEKQLNFERAQNGGCAQVCAAIFDSLVMLNNERHHFVIRNAFCTVEI